VTQRRTMHSTAIHNGWKEPNYQEPDLVEADDEHPANVRTSLLPGNGRFHAPVLDIDIPMTVVESSTPGHHHLYFDVEVPWHRYVVLLDALADAGIVERGWVEASKAEGATCVRLPGVPK
jgi:hypothetical protein